ncbi:PHP domain-containing protein [Vagococcus silagei]|uniref:Histidinol-phosphatase n=1 Tax=Vagococcus silagei TaxID=2508885 RepID=A0A4S3B4V5_9ENTE|nr:PHP domain-containing protein [Vagococcus silagei]THB62111.1 histidinol phosphate phosphatase [Vagococcus silagei]
MTVYYDQHVHTRHSFDSEETIENYLQQTTKQLVTTEHLDFENPSEDFKDSIPNFNRYNDDLQRHEERFERQILRGIEVGYVHDHKNRIEDFIDDKPYDVILLSTHQNGKIDFMDPVVKEFELERLIGEYYEQMIRSVEEMPTANILTHFDYGMRRVDVSVEDYQKLAEHYLKHLFKEMIAKDFALELNAKSFVKYQNDTLYDYAIPLYVAMGGTRFTLGSDAHVAEDYELGFKEMSDVLKRNGVTELVTFKQQIATSVPII